MTIAAETLSRPTSRRPAAEERRRPGKVLVFAAELLPFSETFVRDHVASLRRGSAILVGAKSVAGLSTACIDTALLPNSHWSRILLWLTGWSRAMDRLVEAHDVRLIHAHFADAGARIAAYAARRELPLIVTLHGADILRRPGWNASGIINRLLWRRMVRSTRLFLPVSDHLARKAAERGFPAAKLRRHYLGIPVPRPLRHRRAGGPPTILFIGRMVEKKGLPYLFDGCAILARSGHDFRLRIAGDGPLLDWCRERAKPFGDSVTLLGRLPPERVREELGNADAVCMPSIEAADGDNEGLPIVALEAQAAGVAIVAFDQGPVPECVLANETGLLAEERSAVSLASCLSRLLADPDLRVRLGREGRRHVEKNFDIARQTEELELIYEEVLERASGGPG